MNFKTIIKWLPNWLIIAILLTTFISSFDGVVLAQILSGITSFNRNSMASEVIKYALLSFAALAIVYLAMSLKQGLLNHAVKRMNVNLKSNFLYQQLMQPNFNDDASANVSKIFNDFKLVETNYFSLIFELLSYLLMALVSAIYIFALNVPVGLLFIVCSLLPMLVPKIFGKVLTKSSATWEKDSSTFLGKVTDLFKGMHTIKTYLAEKSLFHDADHYLDQVETSYQTMNDWQAVALFVTAIFSTISYILPIGFGAFLIGKGQTTPAALIAIFMASDRVVGPLRNVAEDLNRMKTTKNVRDTLQEQVIQFTQQPEIPAAAEPAICFDHVAFNYDADKPIIANLNLTIPFGKKVLITGASGAGKSTILNLIQGFIKPTNGQLYLQDSKTKITNILKSGMIAYIEQSPYLLNDTLRFNLTLGEDFTDAECLAVLEKVGLLAELGQDILNKSYGEAGKDLSGGQRQRVEIARALLFNKKIILLDEATSALDPKMTTKVRAVIHELQCTVIEVAHHYDEQEMKHYNFNHYVLADQTLKEV